MPNGDPRDGFFYSTLTLMIDSYNKVYLDFICIVHKRASFHMLWRPALSQFWTSFCYAEFHNFARNTLVNVNVDLVVFTRIAGTS